MILFFDTETTGLPMDWSAPASKTNNWPRMVQLACSLHQPDGELVEHINYLVVPEGYTIPAEATRIHGITTERAHAEGLDLDTVLHDFKELLSVADLLVAHNIEFDEKILGAEYHRKKGKDPLVGQKKYCTMRTPGIIQFCAIPPLRNGYYKWPKLTELHHKLFGQHITDAHNASVDVQATAKCFFELKKRKMI